MRVRFTDGRVGQDISASFGAFGQPDPSGLLALAYDTVTVGSAYNEPRAYSLQELISGPSTVDPLLRDVQPYAILSGRAGKFTIAPAGVPTETKKSALALGGLGIVGAIVGTLLVGVAVGKRL